MSKIPAQHECAECSRIRLGEPRCRWCLDKIFIESVLKLTEEKKKLRDELDALRFDDFADSAYTWQKQALEARRERDALKAENKKLRETIQNWLGEK